MTLNWGHKLMLVFLVFVGMMSYLVYRCIKTNYDLVSTEYYKEELSYQQVIDGTSRANKLGNKLGISQSGHEIKLQLPAEIQPATVNGTVLFYYAADAKRDRQIVLHPDAQGAQLINSSRFFPGSYTVKVKWESKGQQYYSEEIVTIH